LITDPMKLLAYRILDPVNALHHPEAKAKTRASADLTPQIAKRAFELYGGGTATGRSRGSGLRPSGRVRKNETV